MDEWIREIVSNIPIAAVLLYALKIVYDDLKKRMEAADAEREILINALIDNTRRTKIIEKTATGELSPTLPRRPVP